MKNNHPTLNKEKEIRIFVERLIRFASEQVRMGRNYGWSIDTLTKELLSFLHQSNQEVRKEEIEDREKWLSFFSQDIKGCFIPKCGRCGKIATKQTEKGKYAQKNNHRPVNWGYYCKSCYAKGLEEEEEAMYS